jgi:hypothetical protein
MADSSTTSKLNRPTFYAFHGYRTLEVPLLRRDDIVDSRLWIIDSNTGDMASPHFAQNRRKLHTVLHVLTSAYDARPRLKPHEIRAMRAKMEPEVGVTTKSQGYKPLSPLHGMSHVASFGLVFQTSRLRSCVFDLKGAAMWDRLCIQS